MSFTPSDKALDAAKDSAALDGLAENSPLRKCPFPLRTRDPIELTKNIEAIWLAAPRGVNFAAIALYVLLRERDDEATKLTDALD